MATDDGLRLTGEHEIAGQVEQALVYAPISQQ